MIQIIAERRFDGAERPVYVYTERPLIVPSLKGVYTQYAEILDQLPEGERYNLFYTLAHHVGAGTSNKPQRSATTFDYQTALAYDLDTDPETQERVDIDRPLEYAAVIAQVLQSPLEAFTVIVSGNGIHVIHGIRHAIRQSKWFDENRAAYKEILKSIKAEMQARKLPGAPDPKIFDPARVLRLPGSLNRKPGKAETLCKLVQLSSSLLDIDLYAISGLKDRTADNLSPAEIRRQYPAPDFAEVVKECKFVQWAITKPSEVHEPQAFDLFSILAPQPVDALANTPQGMLSPKNLAKSVFDAATNSASLKKTDFEEKWKQAKLYGGRKCTTIHNSWIGGCEQCPHWGKIVTPLALKSKEHIGSESLGFWVMNAKGNYSHPHYEDLAKIFCQEANHVVTEEARLLGYNGKFYKPVPDLRLKAWLEERMNPTEPLRESHRNEFIHKVTARAAVNGFVDTTFFVDSIKGKLNAQNGTLDIVSGVVTPHSHAHGFKYVLPYAVDLDVPGSELFLDWLATITDDRPNLMEAILDVMAYCLWPSYDDHVFTYLVGSGSNGKSTLIHIIQALIGAENYSAVGIQQLCQNRFAPAHLEGKLANLAEESSGGGQEMGVEEVNVLKNLSAGGTMMAERKGEHGFTFSNTAKLIFSANYVPRFKETGHAIKRRLLVIPFDHEIKNPDSGVEKRLIDEVPLIAAMLVKRIQANIAVNNGRFILHRGGKEASEAQMAAQYAGTNILEWAKECIDSRLELGSDACIEVSAAYQHYRSWCEANGFRHPASKPKFGMVMKALIVCKAMGPETHMKRAGHSLYRAYPYTQFKEGVQHGHT